MKPIVIREMEALPGPKLAPVPFNLDQPNMVACSRCESPQPAEAAKCKSCGLRFDHETQLARLNTEVKQKLGAGERDHQAQVAKLRMVDKNLATNVTDAHAMVIRDIEQARDAAAAEVAASKERFEKSCVVVFANDTEESRKARDAAHSEMMSAPSMLELWEGALKQALSLKPLAEEADQLVAAGPSMQAFQGELAKRMAAARKHFDAAFTEVAAAFEAHREHASTMRLASNKRKELDEKLKVIKRSLSLHPKLIHGFGRFAGHTEVSYAATQAIIDSMVASPVEQALVDDLRTRIRWQ
jgi:hypothetical protein